MSEPSAYNGTNGAHYGYHSQAPRGAYMAPRNTRARWPSSASYAKLDTETGLPAPLWFYRDLNELSFYASSQRARAVFSGQLTRPPGATK